MSGKCEDFETSDAMRSEVLAYFERHEPEPRHAAQVCRLALELFDQTGARHGLGIGPRFILEAAALLHDIGWSVAPEGRSHHKLAYRLIREHPWAAVPRAVVPLIALVARYHRKALPRDDHEGFADLAPPQREVVRKLAALLRVADALDRSHQAVVRSVRVEDRGNAVTLHLRAAGPCAMEIAVVREKKDLFEDVYGVPVECAAG